MSWCVILEVLILIILNESVPRSDLCVCVAGSHS